MWRFVRERVAAKRRKNIEMCKIQNKINNRAYKSLENDIYEVLFAKKNSLRAWENSKMSNREMGRWV